MPAAEHHVRGGPPPAKRRFVHDVVLHQGERVEEFEAGRRAQRRIIFPRTTQPAQVHERRPHVLAAVDEPRQYFACDVDLGRAKVGAALAGHELAQMRPHSGTHIVAPVNRNTRPGTAAVPTHAPIRRNQGTGSAVTTVQRHTLTVWPGPETDRSRSRMLGNSAFPIHHIRSGCLTVTPSPRRCGLGVRRSFGAGVAPVWLTSKKISSGL